MMFQSPSRRGQHHCGTIERSWRVGVQCFSPLREGDNIIAEAWAAELARRGISFSPLREGDNIIASGKRRYGIVYSVSVPFAKGTTSLPQHRRNFRNRMSLFQSPSRRGQHHCDLDSGESRAFCTSFSPLREGDNIIALSVGRLDDAECVFQSPSRRGQHHCPVYRGRAHCHLWSFSPLREGDNIIARRTGYRRTRIAECFSPLREGDNIIALPRLPRLPGMLPVSVPFAKGTTSLR